MKTCSIEHYLNRQTMIIGDVNSGKTTLTTLILQHFLDAGYGGQIAVLDLSPDPVQGIGGKLSLGSDTPVLYLTAKIHAPRLMGTDAAHTLRLAHENARTIEALFEKFKQQPRDILCVNDATLYLQSGRLSALLETLSISSTQIINAYYGNTFADSELTQRERRLTEALIAESDEVIRCPDVLVKH
jgi:GTPase SAR1 family protein